MKRIIFLFILIICSVNAIQSKGIPKANPKTMGMDKDRLNRVDQVVDEAIKDSSIVGAVVAVVRHGKMVFLRAYGNKAVYPDTIAMTTNTVFDLASLSKSVSTTLSTMILLERGKVRLHDNVNKYITAYQPWQDSSTEKKQNIEIIDLLTHTSGLPPYAPVSTLKEEYGSPNPSALIDYIAHVKREHQPGTHMTYSCLNFISLQGIIEKITGESLRDFAQENIFRPLGMKHTDYNPTGETLAWTAPTEVQPDGSVLLGKVHDPLARIMNGGISGNAGVFSNAEDLSILATMLMNGGVYKNVRILSPLTVETMRHVPRGYEPFGRALGWDVYSGYASNKGDLLSKSTFGHTGYTGTSMVIDPDTQTAVIVLTNRVHPHDKGSVVGLRAKVANVVASAIVSLN